MMNTDIHQQVVVLGGQGNHKLAQQIMLETSTLLGLRSNLTFTHLHMARYPDGEPDDWITGGEDIVGKHVIILQSIKNLEHLDEFLTLAWSAKVEHNAKSVTGVIPFMRYRRQDNPSGSEINRLRMAILDMGHNRFDNLIFCDLHNKEATLGFCEEAGILGVNADPTPLFADKLRPHFQFAQREDVPFYIYSPDEGSVTRAASIAEILGCEVAFNSKVRKHDGQTKFSSPNGMEVIQKKCSVALQEAGKSLSGAHIAMREDELATGSTAIRTGNYLKDTLGAERVFFLATHAVCVDGWKRTFVHKSPFHTTYLGNTLDRGYFNSTGGDVKTVRIELAIAIELERVLRRLLDTNERS